MPTINRGLVRVCALADLWAGEMRGIELGGRKILLVNVGGTINAFPDRCLHQAMPLSAGRLVGCVLTCAAHEWEYDARTGAGLNPEGIKLSRFPLEIRDGAIWIDPDGGGAHGL